MVLFLVCKIMFTESELTNNDTFNRVIQYFAIAVTLVIVAVPEGMPLAVSIAMAFSVDILKKD